ncbi:MAG: TAT-variant-translocated molybdopterin oxidoreductase [Planctomycetota bacterium]
MTETQLPPSGERSTEPTRTYWRSFDQLAQSPEFLENLYREFPEGASEHSGITDPISRRKFLGVVAASVALAGMASCRKPGRKIVPYTARPEGLTPGVAQHYATVHDRLGYGIGVLARSNDGRPTKLEGNPSHPGSLGGLDSFGQAEVLQLYDPARSRFVLKDGEAEEGHGHEDDHGDHGHDDHGHGDEHHHYTNDEAFEAWASGLAEAAAEDGGASIGVVVPPSASPSVERMLQSVRDELPNVRIARWSALNRDDELAGARAAFGRAVDTQFDFAEADVVASFGADFLGSESRSMAWARGWARGRKVRQKGDSISRLYVAETGYSVTGSNADHRARFAAGEMRVALARLARAVGVTGAAVEGLAGGPLPEGRQSFVDAVAADLQSASGKACVVVGRSQPAALHALGHAINAQLGAVRANASDKKPVWYTATPAGQDANSTEELSQLVTAMKSGSVKKLACLGVNPVYDAPADLGFKEAYDNVGLTLHFGLHVDETAKVSSWHLPLTHELEEWGDSRAFDGTAAIRQPLIAPLYDACTSMLTALAKLVDGDETEDHKVVRETWKDSLTGDGASSAWTVALHNGVIADTASAPLSVSVNSGNLQTTVSAMSALPTPSTQSLELHFAADPTVLDGRYANNAWMQEAPNPIDKLCYDNALLMSRTTAEALGVYNQDLVEIDHGGRKLTVAVWIQPGHADNAVTLTLGHGRSMDKACEVAAETGFNAYPLRTVATMSVASGVSLNKTGGTYSLVTTQEHGVMEGRPIAREGTLAQFEENPSFAPDMSPLAKAAALTGKTEHEELHSLWKERDYTHGHQWGMVIDMNSCTGCGSCVVACIAENNIPMVGKDQIAVGREMHWNRVDRYFSSPEEYSDERVQATQDGVPTANFDDDVQVIHQMIPCMQCENAPCEAVCPVAATMHSPDGLNDMVYNRCIGTRYCNNNCPYKVRRFNWFDFHGDVPAQKQLAFNPEVTVRHRGVMEKCTYCVQRINQAKFSAKLSGTKHVEDGVIKTACEQSCSADAITFGDINDPTTRVAQLRGKYDHDGHVEVKGSPLNYAILSEYNNKPRTTYLAKVRNPNSALKG